MRIVETYVTCRTCRASGGLHVAGCPERPQALLSVDADATPSRLPAVLLALLGVWALGLAWWLGGW